MKISDVKSVASGEAGESLKTSIEDRVKKVVCEALRISSSRYHEELGAGAIPEWDSLGHVGLLQAIEDEFNLTLDVADAIDIETVEDIIGVVKKYLQEAAS